MKEQNELEDLLIKALKKEPETSLPLGFAAIVTRTVFTPKEATFRHSIVALFYGLLISIISCSFLFLIKPSLGHQVFNLLNTGRFVIVTLIVGLLMIQYLDRRFVKTA